MKSLSDQISHTCAINVSIINSLNDHPEFLRACREVPASLGVVPPSAEAPWPFTHNMSWYAYQLYCLVVVPKELYALPEEDDLYTSLVDSDLFAGFDVLKEPPSKSFAEHPKYHLDSFRHAVSHVNYGFDDSTHRFVFFASSQSKPDYADRKWEIAADAECLHGFFRKMANTCMMLYNEIKDGTRQADGLKAG